MTKRKIRFNFLDFLIILLILSTIALGIFLFLPDINHINTNKATATYTVTISNCDQNVANAFLAAYQGNVSPESDATESMDITPETLKVGERKLTDAEILECIVTPSTSYLTNHQTKQVILSENQQTWDVTLVLKSRVTDTEDAFLLGSVPLRVGSNIAVKCQKAAAYGCVTKMITYH